MVTFSLDDPPTTKTSETVSVELASVPVPDDESAKAEPATSSTPRVARIVFARCIAVDPHDGADLQKSTFRCSTAPQCSTMLEQSKKLTANSFKITKPLVKVELEPHLNCVPQRLSVVSSVNSPNLLRNR